MWSQTIIPSSCIRISEGTLILKDGNLCFCYSNVRTIVGSSVVVDKIIYTLHSCSARQERSVTKVNLMHIFQVVHCTQVDKQQILEAKIINSMPWNTVACHSNNLCIFQLFLWKQWHHDNWPEVFIEVERTTGTSGCHRVWQQWGPRRQLQVPTPALCWKCHH